MLRKVKDSTIELLKSNLEYLNITSEIKEKDIDIIFEYFEKKEIEYSTRQLNDENINKEEFDKVCLAVDDFFVDADSEDSVDLDYLNERLNLK